MKKRVKESIGYGGLAIMLFGGMLGGLTQTAMNTTLAQVSLELDMGVTFSQWLVNVFPLCLGVTIPLSAHLSRAMSARAMFLLSMGLFIAGTAIIIPSSFFPLLIVGRILEGCSAGILFPLLQVVVFSQFPLNKRGTIMGFVGLTFGFAPNIGPTIAGAFTTAFGWRSCFVFLLAFAAVVTVLGLILLSRTPVEPGKRAFDLRSVIYSTFGFGGLLMGFTNAGDYGLATVECLLPLGVGVLAMALFAVRQLRISNPLLDLMVFRNREFTVGTIILCFLFCANIGTALVIPLELQQVHGFSAFEAGLALLPGTVAALVVNPVSGAIMDRTGARRVSCVCAVVLLAGSAALLNLGEMTSLPVIMVLQLVRQIGISGVIMPVNTWSMNTLPKHLISDGTSVTNTVRQVAAALGTAVMVLLMAGRTSDGTVSAAGVNDAMLFALVLVVILTVLCFLFVKDNSKLEK